MSRGRALEHRKAIALAIALAGVGGGLPLSFASGQEPPAPPAAPPTSVKPAAEPAPANAAAGEADGDDEHAPPEKTTPAPAPKAPAGALKPFVTKDGMVHVPGGRFTMGSSEKAAPPNERPARQVTTGPFWIDRTEVTVGAYRSCVERGLCQRPPRTSAQCTYDLGDPQLPVSCIPWSSAQAYCLAIGKRLPREVEWELAARGTNPVRYPWGTSGIGCGLATTLVRDNSQRSCSAKHPSRVATHLGGASPHGALDMSGNVEEWVADWYAESMSELSPRAGASHVLRGGGWLTWPSLARTTSRNWGSVREAGPNVGFRCARDD
ncbi:Sulfatase modifying factor 1 precursor (C-alpha-formyglycine- generating enzyme 1) [Labilithrix luteola]|uniref:Sulfatase modifying factor 1 (C-alpha-formyglycine-generating enzyme 1) n=1 Tax=Labilithrix luteola TaxID=1391654 RepID=A0A0K1Q3I7_9BACT|nr:SUMF1/EgtB/PvdO family nonheme iron enzyme [Labilithrix luteola]AKU99934.1 Sulfatase modifying factor 1 precursor (C-alpha-formyglycine- generating enzyme 1) [Labilithrix luteola]